MYVANLEGLNAAQTSDFRRQAFKNNIKLKVVKNTLLQKAMEQIEGVDYSEMFPTFKGNTAVMIAETANAPAKLIQGFRKKMLSQLLNLLIYKKRSTLVITT